MRFTKNLDFSYNRIYRVNHLSLLFSGLLTLRFSDTERVLISGTRIVSERDPEGGKIDFLQIQIENAKNASARREIQTVRVLASHGNRIGFTIAEIWQELSQFLTGREKTLGQILASNAAVRIWLKKFVWFPFRDSLPKAIRDTLPTSVTWMTIRSSLMGILLYDFEIDPETLRQLTRHKSTKTLLGTYTFKSKNAAAKRLGKKF